MRDSTATRLTRSQNRRSPSSRGKRKEREKGKEGGEKEKGEIRKKEEEWEIATPMDDSDAQNSFGPLIEDLVIIRIILLRP